MSRVSTSALNLLHFCVRSTVQRSNTPIPRSCVCLTQLVPTISLNIWPVIYLEQRLAHGTLKLFGPEARLNPSYYSLDPCRLSFLSPLLKICDTRLCVCFFFSWKGNFNVI